jgi:hypothetical protein
MKHCLSRIGLAALRANEYCVNGSNVALLTALLLFAIVRGKLAWSLCPPPLNPNIVADSPWCRMNLAQLIVSARPYAIMQLQHKQGSGPYLSPSLRHGLQRIS